MAPYRQIITHGWVVDGEGKKQSKSLGNVTAPQEIISKSGADVLRFEDAPERFADLFSAPAFGVPESHHGALRRRQLTECAGRAAERLAGEDALLR